MPLRPSVIAFLVLTLLHTVHGTPVYADGELSISTRELLSQITAWQSGGAETGVQDLLETASLWQTSAVSPVDGEKKESLEPGETRQNPDLTFAIQVAAWLRGEADGDLGWPREASVSGKFDLPGLLATIGDGTLVSGEAATDAVQAVRDLPQECETGQPYTVSIAITAAETPDAIAVEETVPDGWQVTEVSDGGAFNAETNLIRWFLISGFDTTLTYVVTPSNSSGDFNGTLTYILNGSEQSATIGGESVCGGGGSDLVTATRVLPDTCAPGQAFTATIQLGVSGELEAVAIEETIPEGWTASNVDNGGVYDPENRMVRWFLLSGFETTLSYDAIPNDTEGVFAGVVSYTLSGVQHSLTVGGDEACGLTAVESWGRHSSISPE